MNQKYTSIYLNDHLAGAVVGEELAKRCLSRNRSTPLGSYLQQFLVEVDEDRQSLEQIMERLGVAKSPVKQRAAWAAEKLGRLKANGHILSPSPLSSVVELEGLVTGVQGKLSAWENLEAAGAGGQGVLGVDLAALIARAKEQLERLRELRLEAARQALAGG
jgi:hypothetical protein